MMWTLSIAHVNVFLNVCMIYRWVGSSLPYCGGVNPTFLTVQLFEWSGVGIDHLAQQ